LYVPFSSNSFRHCYHQTYETFQLIINCFRQAFPNTEFNVIPTTPKKDENGSQKDNTTVELSPTTASKTCLRQETLESYLKKNKNNNNNTNDKDKYNDERNDAVDSTKWTSGDGDSKDKVINTRYKLIRKSEYNYDERNWQGRGGGGGGGVGGEEVNVSPLKLRSGKILSPPTSPKQHKHNSNNYKKQHSPIQAASTSSANTTSGTTLNSDPRLKNKYTYLRNPKLNAPTTRPYFQTKRRLQFRKK